MLKLISSLSSNFLLKTGNARAIKYTNHRTQQRLSIPHTLYRTVVNPSSLRCCSTNTTSSASFTHAMDEAIKNKVSAAAGDTKKSKREPYKPRYDGRSKKRNWVDYNDRNEEAAANPEKRAAFNPADRVRRRKYCVLMGYSGVNYFGMQRNPEMKTIEEDLLKAMLNVKWITEEGYQQAQTTQFQRAARTDKGVSAARQCVSMKLPDEINLDDINKELPEQIRVFAARRVTKGFNSKEKCCGRTYTYTLPTIAFAHHKQTIDDCNAFRVSSAKIAEVNELLKMYLGTKCFHNFTSRKDFIDPSSKRYIISFECGRPFVEPKHGIELAVFKVKGQSFMLHQIRKMVGLILAIVRGHTTAATLERAFGEARIDIPMAPGLGLVLDQVHYDRYNERYASDGIHDALAWHDEEPTIQAFFDTYIRPTMVETEVREASMATWLQTLALHSYDVRVDAKQADSTAAHQQGVGDGVETTQTSSIASTTDETNALSGESLSDATLIGTSSVVEATVTTPATANA